MDKSCYFRFQLRDGHEELKVEVGVHQLVSVSTPGPDEWSWSGLNTLKAADEESFLFPLALTELTYVPHSHSSSIGSNTSQKKPPQ